MVALEKKRLTIDDYHAMIKAGILTEEDKIELLNGELIIMSPVGPSHSGTIDLIDTQLKVLLHKKAIVRNQGPVTLPYHSEPEPDLAVAKYRPDFYTKSHPGPDDILISIEVADTSLERDRTVKAALYATHLIPTYWIVNLQDRQIEVYTQPKDGQYRTRQTFLPGEELELPDFGLKVAVEDLLGPAPE